MLAIYTSAAFSTAAGLAVAPTADIEVRLDGPGGGALASIFSDIDGTTPIAQPGFQADANGRFAFYAAGRPGGYQVKVTKGAETYTVHNQAIGLAAQLDPTAVGSALLGAASEAAARTTLQLDVVLHSLYGPL